ncbi:hypothetical protein QFZ58_003886 [Streptomyces sp. B1I3]|nr:hypothetical protein [Streptomyces sp. B1I3]
MRQARRRAEEAERRAVDARERAERLQGAASVHHKRFAGGQPILMRHSGHPAGPGARRRCHPQGHGGGRGGGAGGGSGARCPAADLAETFT